MPSPRSSIRATVISADPCTGARKNGHRSGADSPQGIDHGQSDGARVPPRWSGHRGRLVAPDESARSRKATLIWAVARRSRYVPLRFTSRHLRRASQEPHEKGTGRTSAAFQARRSTPRASPMQLSDRVTGLFMVALGGLAAYGGSRLPPVPGQQIGPDVFPLVVGIGLAICGAMIALRIGRRYEEEAEADLAQIRTEERRVG